MDHRQSAPRSIGEILDVTIRVYRATLPQWWPWAVAFAALTIVTGLLEPASLTGVGPKASLPELIAALSSPMFLAGVLLLIVVSVWLYAALTTALAGAYVGAPISHGRAASSGIRLMLPFCGLGILTGLLTLLGFVALIIPGFLLLGRLLVANTALVVEQGGVFAALSRSWALTKGRWWHATTAMFVGGLIVFVVASILVAILVAALVFLFSRDPALMRLVTMVLQAISQFFTASFIPILSVVLYYDLKTRADGDDLERRAGALASA